MSPRLIKLLHRKSASKAELRQALADALCVPCPSWGYAKMTVFSACRNLFTTLYEKHTGIDYCWQAKDAGCLNSVIKKLYRIADRTTDDQIIHAFEFLMQKLPEWYLEHGFSLCVINSKFNEIIAEIKKNGTDKKGKISASYKQKVFGDLYASGDE